MSRDDEAKNDRLFDNRTVERNIRKGLITRKDYEKHLKTLPDATDKIAPAEVLRAVAQISPAAEMDHFDAVLGKDEGRHAEPAPHTIDGQRATDVEGEGDEDAAELDDDDLEDEDEEVETEPPRN